MANVARVEATITAQNKLRGGLSSAERDLDRFRRTQARAADAIGRSLTQGKGLERMERAAGALRTTMLGIGAGFGAQMGFQSLRQAATRFAEVDRAMARTGITGDALADETRKGTVELRNLARDTATLFDPAQKGLDAITASGREFGEAMKMMPSVLKTAQASGAGVDDIANSSTSLLDHMKISIDQLQEAQDTLAMGGKLGKFELKDMARYLPAMLPAFKAVGKSGMEGLQSLVAILQVIRSGTGTAEEAASSAQNIFAKMESDKTVENFKEIAKIDLEKEFAKARKEGKDLLDVFIQLSHKAINGDLSKVPKLFNDMEFARGMRPLLAEYQKRFELIDKLKNAKGTIDIDFKRINGDAQASLDRFAEAADRAKSSLGELATQLAAPAIANGATNLDALAQAMERAAKAGREGGPAAAVKQIGSDVATAVGNDLSEGRKNMAGLQEDYDNRKEIERIERPKQGGWFDWLTGDTSREATQRELDRLREKEKRGPLNPFERKNKQTFEKRLADQDTAWSRDQLRRVGPMPKPVTSDSPDFAADIEAAREARRAAAFSRSEKPAEPVDGLVRNKGKAQSGRVLPPQRPNGLGALAMPGFGADDPAQSEDFSVRPAGFALDGVAMSDRPAAPPAQADPPPDYAPPAPPDVERDLARIGRVPPAPPPAQKDPRPQERQRAGKARFGLSGAEGQAPDFGEDQQTSPASGSRRPGQVRSDLSGAERAIPEAGRFTLNGIEDAASKVDEVKSSVEAIGPAGATAGAALATGFSSGLARMEAEADAAIARIQQKLNSLRAPSLSFGGGVSGLNTGRGMQEVR